MTTPYPQPSVNVYRFRVDDADPEVPIFGCVARSTEEATLVAHGAGHRQLTLLDWFPLDPENTFEATMRRIEDNPLLGPRWLPFVDVISAATQTLTTGRFWTINTHLPRFGYDATYSPFVQAMAEADGSLHVEIGGMLSSAVAPYRAQMLAILGWTDFATEDAIDPENQRALPLPHRVFEPGWNSALIFESIMMALILGFGVTDADLFHIPGQTLPLDEIPGIDVIRDPVFRLQPATA